jgi:phage FluMu gp28-like protein
MVAFIKRHPAASVWMDSTGVGSPIYEAVRKALPNQQIHGYHLTSQSKSDLITNLAMQIEQRRMTIQANPIQENELKSYEYTFNPRTRNVSMNAPEGMHDDCVIALALAAWPLRTGNFGAAFDTDDFNIFWNS